MSSVGTYLGSFPFPNFEETEGLIEEASKTVGKNLFIEKDDKVFNNTSTLPLIPTYTDRIKPLKIQISSLRTSLTVEFNESEAKKRAQLLIEKIKLIYKVYQRALSIELENLKKGSDLEKRCSQAQTNINENLKSMRSIQREKGLDTRYQRSKLNGTLKTDRSYYINEIFYKYFNFFRIVHNVPENPSSTSPALVETRLKELEQQIVGFSSLIEKAKTPVEKETLLREICEKIKEFLEWNKSLDLSYSKALPSLQEMKKISRKEVDTSLHPTEQSRYLLLDYEGQINRLQIASSYLPLLFQLNIWAQTIGFTFEISLPILLENHLKKMQQITLAVNAAKLEFKKVPDSLPAVSPFASKLWASLLKNANRVFKSKENKENDSYLSSLAASMKDISNITLTPQGLKDYYTKGSFDEGKLSSLKKEKARIESSLAHLDQGSEEHAQAEKELIKVKRELYSTILGYLIEGIRKRQSFIRYEGENYPQDQKNLIVQEIRVLNKKFNRCMRVYEALPQENALNPLYAIFNNPLTDATKTVAKLKQQKQYADLGYYPMVVIQNWVKEARDSQKPLNEYLLGLVTSFYKWADSHPHIAANLAADIAQVIATLNDASLVENFKKTMLAKAWTTAFLRAWGAFPEEEPIEQEGDLKYRALADYCAYAPVITAVGKGLQKGIAGAIDGNIHKLYIDPLYHFISAVTIQKAGRLIPDSYSDFAVSLVQIIQGEDFYKILETKRNIELVRLGGAIKSVLLNNEHPFDYLKREAELWYKTFLKAGEQERNYRVLCQIVPAAVAAVASLGLITICLLDVSMKVHRIVITLLPAIIGFMLKIIGRSTFLDSLYDTRSRVKKEFFEENKEKMRQLIRENEEHQGKLEIECKALIRDLEKYGMLPLVLEPQGSLLLAEEINLIETSVRTLEQAWSIKLDQSWKSQTDKNNIYQMIQFFNGIVKDYAKLREQAKECITPYIKKDSKQELEPNKEIVLIEKITSQVVQRLIHNWLKKNLKEGLNEQMIDLSINFESEKALEGTTEVPEKFLRQKLLTKNPQLDNALVKEGLRNLFLGLENARGFTGSIG